MDYKIKMKKVIYFLVFFTGLLHIFIKLMIILKKNHHTIILFYHRFKNDKNDKNLLPCLDVREFWKQISYLKKYYNFISMDELGEALKEKKIFKAPSIAITIDDGYLDNYKLAYPILGKNQIPTVIYLTGGLIGKKKGLWVDDLELALLHAKVHSFRFEELFGTAVIDISTYHGKKKAEEMLFTRMVRLGNPERERLIQKLFNILHVERMVIGNHPRTLLNWEEIAEMSENRISFGAHTLSHPFLPSMKIENAKEEIKRSKEVIENTIKKPVKHFAIPNGKPEDFNDELREYCKEIGFDTVVTTEPGAVNSDADRYSLKRVVPPPPIYYFACEIVRYLFLNGK